MSDDWMDAFRSEDLADPELARIDAAVDRLAAPIPRRRVGRWAVGIGLALAAAAALALALHHPPPAPISPTPPDPIAQVASPPPPAPPIPTPTPPPTERPPRPAPAALPGLAPAADAVLVVREGRAVLERGRLSYLHDPTHDPGVDSVGFASVPVTLVPMGTAFTVEARDGLGAVRVDAGRVQAVHRDGPILADLRPGQEALLVTDPSTAIGVRVIQTTGLALDAVVAELPVGCACRPADAVSAVASLRLSTRTPELP